MTHDERISAAFHKLLPKDEPSEYLREAWRDTIIAAVAEDRKTRPHEFVGRTDRWCELCDKPDRDEIHIMSREHLKRWIDREVEAEREETRLKHACQCSVCDPL